MEQKNIVSYEKEYESKHHPSIKGLQIIEGKNNFPISWLNQQGYCEYQLYLEYVKGIETQPTHAMTHGSQVHKELENIFKEASEPSSFEPKSMVTLERAALLAEYPACSGSKAIPLVVLTTLPNPRLIIPGRK